MKYIDEQNINQIGKDWKQILNVIGKATKLLKNNEYAQPVKPYLRYNDLSNRIIAMPAYLGGEFDVAGIKWIASFPKNIEKGIPRANSVIILNESETGVPICSINTGQISAIRTAGVTGSIIDKYLKIVDKKNKINIGIIGFGPIGRMHLEMVFELFYDIVDKAYIYDINTVDTTDIPQKIMRKLVIVDSWKEAYQHATIFITCTVSKERYINIPPPKGSLQLNVSLRDYKPMIIDYVNHIIVDSWEEICRENTDIEVMSIHKGLKQENVNTMFDFLYDTNFQKNINQNDVIMFNPMGMAIYDLAIAKYYFQLSKK